MRLALVGCLALLAALSPARGQDGLLLHAVESGTGEEAVLGEALLDLPLGAIQTVGLEEDADGTFAVTVWLTPSAATDLTRVTAAATGSVVAVVHRGRVLDTPRVDSAVPNGLVMLPGFSEADAGTLAQSLRGEAGAPSEPSSDAQAELDRLLGAGPTPDPPAANPPVVDTDPAQPPTQADPDAARPEPLGVAEAVAQDFVTALDRREWARAADRLHPDAQAVLREDALATVRLDGATVRVREGLTEAAFPLASVLPDARGPLDGMTARDLSALYLAGLDALGAWGAPGPPRSVVGQVADGPVVHVLLRGDRGIDAGASAVTVVTLRPDAAGTWRVMLTDARGF